MYLLPGTIQHPLHFGHNIPNFIPNLNHKPRLRAIRRLHRRPIASPILRNRYGNFSVSIPMNLQGRAAGGFYLLTIITGMFGAFTSSNSYGDAANLISTACYVVVTLLLYRLLKPVNGPIAMLATAFGLITCILGGLDTLHYHPIPIHYLVFSGVYCLLVGYLIFKSAFLPRFLGVLLALSGLGWLTFLSPHLAHQLLHYTMVSGLLGEGSLTLWLLFVGINVERWQQQASVNAMQS